MNKRLYATKGLAALALIALPLIGCAQVPVDDRGNAIGSYEPVDAAAERPVGNEDIPLLVESELQELVGPIALYPDDLLAIVLPASAYPLQIIEAGRFLEELENDSSLKPDPEWDDSVVALLNYPEVVELLNDDIDWTWRLGEAVVAQQDDVVAAIETFRDRAYAAGNLRSDEYQTVSQDNGVIEISPVSEDVIYVPYYEPERVVVYQPRPVYYYYPRAYPVYYYPYPSSYYFDRGYFWGVTTAFSIGWISDSLHVYHHSYYGHPYYGRSYWDRWWYRRPSINVYNTTYVRNTRVTVNRYYGGDRWRPRHNRRDLIPATRPRTMNYHYQRDRHGTVERQLTRTVNERRARTVNTRTRNTQATRTTHTDARPSMTRPATRPGNTRNVDTRQARVREPIRFRDRSDEPQARTRRQETPTKTRAREPVARERAMTAPRQPTVRQPTRTREAVASRDRSAPRTQPQARRQTAQPQTQARRQEVRPQPQARRQEVRPQPQARRQESRPQARQPARAKSEAKREAKRESRTESRQRGKR